LGKQDREKFFRQKLFGSKGSMLDSFYFQSDLEVNFCFSNRNLYFWPQFWKSTKFYIQYDLWMTLRSKTKIMSRSTSNF